MEKTVILLYQDGGVCSLLHVVAPGDGLMEALSAAEHNWSTTKKGIETDYDSFVLKYLTDHGYKIRMDDNFETYQTCL